jgi:hypothetical protein
MKALLLFPLLFSALSAEPAWKPLFNGRDLTGWRQVGKGSFRVMDGQLESVDGMGLLYWTGGPVQDCRIRVVFRLHGKNDNSGVYVRIPVEPREPVMPIHYGYEVQIETDPERWKEGDYHYTGTLYSLTKAKVRNCKPGPEWNEMVITLDGDRTIVHVNGQLVTDYREGDPTPERLHDYEPLRGRRPRAGWFGLQNHSKNDVLYFKDVSIQPLR